jgi:hypothetical protein
MPDLYHTLMQMKLNHKYSSLYEEMQRMCTSEQSPLFLHAITVSNIGVDVECLHVPD